MKTWDEKVAEGKIQRLNIFLSPQSIEKIKTNAQKEGRNISKYLENASDFYEKNKK